jgi:hypothetical protein
VAKKKRKRRRSRAKQTLPGTPMAKKRDARASEDAPRKDEKKKGNERTDGDAPETSHSLPPTKKSNLPPEQAHDDREIDAWTIIRFGSIVLGLTALSMIVMWGLGPALESSERSRYEPPSPMASRLPDEPAGPKLQRIPKKGLEALRAQEREQLETYGWVDEDNGVVQIPIERAMELLAERGLPARSAEEPRDDVSMPTDSSLGTRRSTR